MPLTRNHALIAALIAAALTLAAMGSQMIGAEGMRLANGQPLFGDFFAFWSAGRFALEGHAADAYSQRAIFEAQQAALPGLNVVFPFRHPPPFLFIAAPFALMPFPVAASLFLIAIFAFFIWVARLYAAKPSDIFIAAAMPAIVLHMGSVQMGLLIAAISGLAIAWTEKRPRAAGALIGLLVIKPHLAVLWPVMLAIQGRWRTIIFAAAIAGALALLAGFVFGWQLYPLFFNALARGQHAVSETLIARATMTSLYANLIGLGAPHWLALALHALSALAAISLAILIWRRKEIRTSAAALVAATLLVSPYLFFYDEVLILIAIAAFYPDAKRGESYWLAFAWIASGLSLALGAFITLPLCAVACWAVLIIAARRAGLMRGGIAALPPA